MPRFHFFMFDTSEKGQHQNRNSSQTNSACQPLDLEADESRANFQNVCTYMKYTTLNGNDPMQCVLNQPMAQSFTHVTAAKLNYATLPTCPEFLLA
jgi:hypothetical protein